LDSVLEVIRCVILARELSNPRSRLCGVVRAGGVASSNPARRGEMWSRSVYFQFRPLGGGFRSGVESTIERAMWSERVGGSEGFQEEKKGRKAELAKDKSRTAGRWLVVKENLV